MVLTCHDLGGRHHACSQSMQLLKGLVAAWLHGVAAVIQSPSAWLHGAAAVIQSPNRAALAALVAASKWQHEVHGTEERGGGIKTYWGACEVRREIASRACLLTAGDHSRGWTTAQCCCRRPAQAPLGP